MNFTEIQHNAPFYPLTDCYRVLHDYVEAEGWSALHHIRIRPILELGLPAREVHQIIAPVDDRQVWIIEVNLYGFYGQGSPLPTYFTEELMHAQSIDLSQARHFLDLLHQRLYQLVVQTRQWSDIHHSSEQVQQAHASMLALASLNVIDNTSLSHLDNYGTLLRLINVFRHQKNTQAGVQAVFAVLIKAESIHVESFSHQRTRVSSNNFLKLGRKTQGLGQSALVGRRIDNTQNKIKIIITGIRFSHYQKWVLTPKHLALLQQMCRLILSIPMTVEMVFYVKPSKAMYIPLGKRQDNHKKSSAVLALGKNSWLGQSDKPNYVQASTHLI